MLKELLRRCLHPCFRWVYKYEFQRHAHLVQVHAGRMGELHRLKSELERMHDMYTKCMNLLADQPVSYVIRNRGGVPVIVSFVAAGDQFCIFRGTSLCTPVHSVKEVVLNLSLNRTEFVGILESWGICGTSPSETILIDDFTVLPSEQGKGYGRAVLEFLFEWGRRRGVKYVIGRVVFMDWSRQEWLLPFYQSVGFELKKTGGQDYRMLKKIAGGSGH